MDTFNDIWKEVLALCKTQVNETIYNMWIAPLEFIKYENDTVVFLVNSDFRKTVVLDKYSDIIKSNFESIMGFPVSIDIIVDNLSEKPAADKDEDKSGGEPERGGPFSQFTFDNFIVGKSNNFAYNVSMGVAENPGIQYNPLLIYGRSGLGKTHLMFAIYNRIKEKNPDSVLIYTTGESFMSELVDCISKKNTTFFHNKYRNVDALLIDDIQIIQKGVSVQEEFFHTFNALEQAGKQIVMTSDVPPKEMEVLDERLRTRFEMGVLADIQPPDIDTRKAIILKKCEKLNIKIKDSTINYIVEKIKCNVRQLEGAVKKIDAFLKIYGISPSIEQIQKIIDELINDNLPVTVVADRIIEQTAEYFGVTPDEIKSNKQNKPITQARNAAIYIIKEVTDLTLQGIGDIFNKKHTTMMHSINKCKAYMEESASYKNGITSIMRDFQDK